MDLDLITYAMLKKKMGELTVDEKAVVAAVNKYMKENPVTVTEVDPTVPAWAKAAQKPTYTAAEVGALPADTQIPVVPTKVSEFENDKGYLTEHQSLDGYAKLEDIPAMPVIPEIPTELPNPHALTIGEQVYDGTKEVVVETLPNPAFLTIADPREESGQKEYDGSNPIHIDAVPNPYDLTIGDKTYNGAQPVEVKTLPNPEALSIKYSTGDVKTYDGTAPKDLLIPMYYNETYKPDVWAGGVTVDKLGITYWSQTGAYAVIGKMMLLSLHIGLTIPAGFAGADSFKISLPGNTAYHNQTVAFTYMTYGASFTNAAGAVRWNNEGVISLLNNSGMDAKLTENAAGGTGYIDLLGWVPLP